MKSAATQARGDSSNGDRLHARGTRVQVHLQRIMRARFHTVGKEKYKYSNRKLEHTHTLTHFFSLALTNERAREQKHFKSSEHT